MPAVPAVLSHAILLMGHWCMLFRFFQQAWAVKLLLQPRHSKGVGQFVANPLFSHVLGISNTALGGALGGAALLMSRTSQNRTLVTNHHTSM